MDGRWIVLKFGGTSVSSLERWETIRSVIEQRRREGLRPLLVCSALSQISNQLEELLAEAEAGTEPSPKLETLRETHALLAIEMGVDAISALRPLFDELARTLLGITLTREVTPRLRARVLAQGELLSTRLGAEWLRSRGVGAVWQDARDLLEARPERRTGPGHERQYLSATCDYDPDPALCRRLDRLQADVVVTQGFIARAPDGVDTVLLGRGGSDTSAAYLAARLSAARLEIWTDVPGLFTANPSRISEARLLRRLDYAEAGELAARGAKVLHPRCLQPLREHGIPLHVRCTRWPELDGTVIERRSPRVHPGILGVVARKGLILVSMDLEGTWQRVGVIAEIASCFQHLGLSIDMLASSQTHVTVALDPEANPLSEPLLEALLRELEEVCSPRLERPAAAVSLVGTSIADVLHELGPLLENLEHENVHLLSHAANDLSLTIVVDQEASDRLVQRLHDKTFGGLPADGDLGPTWAQLRTETTGQAGGA